MAIRVFFAVTPLEDAVLTVAAAAGTWIEATLLNVAAGTEAAGAVKVGVPDEKTKAVWPADTGENPAALVILFYRLQWTPQQPVLKTSEKAQPLLPDEAICPNLLHLPEQSIQVNCKPLSISHNVQSMLPAKRC